MKFKDVAGQTFGAITILKEVLPHVTPNGTKQRRVLCQCSGGTRFETQLYHLTSGHTKSCGCLQKEKVSQVNTSHGLVGTRLYSIYRNMFSRCYKKYNKAYQDYGARGIKICDEWLDDFQSFYDWSIANDYQENLSIDQIDNNKGYSPDNCRWTDRTTQNRNTRPNKVIVLNNEAHWLSEWCEILNIKRGTVDKLLQRSWSIEKNIELWKG